MGAALTSTTRLAAYLTVTLIAAPLQIAALITGHRLAKVIPSIYHRACLRVLGIRVSMHGRRAAPGPVLFVVNHSSYLDISVIGALFRGSFVAKAEVAGWPLFGTLAKLQRTVFVERRRGQTAAQRGIIEARLREGDNLVLFAEGTSNDGNRVLPFKSALFSVAEDGPDGKPLTVQPVSLAYTQLDGIPIGRALRPSFAWYGDMEMAGHLWHALGLGVLRAEVIFHPPVTLAQFGSRKRLAAHCQEVVARGVCDLISGRHNGPQKPLQLDDDLDAEDAPVPVDPDQEILPSPA